jgi:hypothetical protein
MVYQDWMDHLELQEPLASPEPKENLVIPDHLD